MAVGLSVLTARLRVHKTVPGVPPGAARLAVGGPELQLGAPATVAATRGTSYSGPLQLGATPTRGPELNSNSGHQLLLPPANWCHTFAAR